MQKPSVTKGKLSTILSNTAALEIFLPLNNKLFRRLFLMQSIALIGNGLTTTALALLAYELQAQQVTLVLGAAMAVKMLAYILIAPLAMAMFSKLFALYQINVKWLLVGSNLARAVLIGALFFCSQIWQLLAIMFLLNAVTACYTPLYQAILPQVLKSETNYNRALALSQIANETETLASPAVAALLLLAMPFDAIFALAAVLFCAVVGLLLGIEQLPKQSDEHALSAGKRIFYGLSCYLKTPRLKAVLAFNLVLAVAGAMVIINSVLIVKQYLNLHDQRLPLLLLAAGLGAICASFGANKLYAKFSQRQTMFYAALATVLCLLIGAALSFSAAGFYSFCALWLAIGAGNALLLIPSLNIVRASSNPQDRNDYYAANFSLTHFAWLFAYLLAGILANYLTLGWVFIILAIIAVVATFYAASVWQKNDQYVLQHSHEFIEHEHYHSHDAHHRHHLDEKNYPPRHRHRHVHLPLTHSHYFVIDEHHLKWPRHK